MLARDYITAEEWQLLAFFEAEPKRLDPYLQWPYNTFEYRTRIDDLDITFSVEPAHKDFTLTVMRTGVKHLEYTALSVEDIRYHDDAGEWLEILLPQLRRELRLRPTFSLLGLHRP